MSQSKNSIDHSAQKTLESTRTKILELKEKNKEIIAELKTFNIGPKGNALASSLIAEHKQNTVMISRLKNIETMFLEAEIATLTANAMQATKETMKITKKKLKAVNFDEYEKYHNRLQDDLERTAELNDLYDCDDGLCDSDEIKNELDGLLNQENDFTK